MLNALGKCALSLVFMICASQCCFAARDKGFGLQTDFKNMGAQEVLAWLNNAERIRLEPKLIGEKHNHYCNGERPKWAAMHRLETACADTREDINNKNILLFNMEALFRGCGIYALTQEESWGDDRSGATCGLLGDLFFTIGNIDAAKMVWEQAPGCHSRDINGNPTNGCMRFIVGQEWEKGPITWAHDHSAQIKTAYQSDQGKLFSMARIACSTELDVASCEYLNRQGGKIDIGAVRRAQDERRHDFIARADNEQEERVEQSREKDARFNAVMAGLQSMPAASDDPNAIVNAGNQQAAAIRGIGDANAAQQQSASQQRLAAQQAAQLAAQQQAAARQAQQAVNQNASSNTASASAGNAGGNTSTTAGQYGPSLSATCIHQFWDPKFYNWLSFENTCGQAIHLDFIATNTNDTFGMSSTDIAPGQASNTGWSQGEVNRKGGFTVFVCPAGYIAVDSVTRQSVSRPNQDYLCKKW